MIPEAKASQGAIQTVWLKCNTPSTSKHQLFLKGHSVRNQEDKYPRGRTLLVLNIPPYATLASIQMAFSRHCGRVQHCEFNTELGKQSGFKAAYVVFSNDFELEKALSLPDDFTFVLNPDDAPTCMFGLKKWCKQYNATIIQQNEKSLKQSIEKYIREYDTKRETKLAADSNKNPDEEWTTLTSKKKRGKFPTVRKKSVMSKMLEDVETNQKNKQLLNFYTFQIRESKKQHIIELRKKFELDKKKLQQLKANRRFKPFG